MIIKCQIWKIRYHIADMRYGWNWLSWMRYANYACGFVAAQLPLLWANSWNFHCWLHSYHYKNLFWSWFRHFYHFCKIYLPWAMSSNFHCWWYKTTLGEASEINTGLFGNFSQHRGGGGLLNPKTFVILNSALWLKLKGTSKLRKRDPIGTQLFMK